MGGELLLPRRAIDARKLCVLRRRELRFDPRPGEVFEARHDPERCLDSRGIALAAARDPLKHAHVLAEARPDELAFRVAAEPVHPEDLRRTREAAAHLQPVAEVVAHVVATESKHRHRIAPDHADFPVIAAVVSEPSVAAMYTPSS